MAVTVAGVVMGNLETRVGDELRQFKDCLTVMLVGLLFVLLAADVPLDDVRGLGTSGLIVVGLLIVCARPLSVWLSTRGLNLPVGERVFMGAVAPRGIVAAAVTSITAVTLDSQGIEGGDALKALVFLVIGATVVVSGVSARPLSTLLAVRLPRRDRVAILGARGLALALAQQLRDADIPVVFLEPDPKRSRAAEEAGYTVVFGDPLEERTMLRTRPELVGVAVGLTFNEHLNSLFVRQALDSFGVPRRDSSRRNRSSVSRPRACYPLRTRTSYLMARMTTSGGMSGGVTDRLPSSRLSFSPTPNPVSSATCWKRSRAQPAGHTSCV
jgi:hypothetical protein